MELDNILLFAWITSMAIVLYFVDHKREEIVSGKRVMRYKPFLAVILFVPIIIFCVYGRVRSDTFAYLISYGKLPTSPSGMWKYFAGSEEKGWALFSLLVHTLSSGNETAYRFAIALAHSIPLIIILRRYSANYLLSLFLLVAGGYHLGWMTNGMRQFMAVTIIFAATPWIVEQRFIPAVLTVLLAATFHRTALYMLPVIFIVQGRIWDYRTLIVIMAVTVLVYIVGTNTKVFDDFAEFVGYSTDAAKEWGDDGANPVRVLVAAVPAVMSFVFRWQIRDNRNPAVNIFVNMSVLTVAMNVFAVFTSGIMTGRMVVYTSVYNLILLPELLTNYLREPRTRRFFHMACVGLFFLYFLYDSGTLVV